MSLINDINDIPRAIMQRKTHLRQLTDEDMWQVGLNSNIISNDVNGEHMKKTLAPGMVASRPSGQRLKSLDSYSCCR